MLAMEREGLSRGQAGAMYVADYMVKGREHPLAAAAAEGARKALAEDGPARETPKGQPYGAGAAGGRSAAAALRQRRGFRPLSARTGSTRRGCMIGNVSGAHAAGGR